MAEDKKGKGSGTKDACYHKVKSRYSVWPSAYASGALVKCRKVGAKNWGNKSESFEMQEGGNFMRGKDSQIARSTGAGALTPDAAKQLGKKAEELQKKKAAKVDLPNIKKEELNIDLAVDYFFTEGINEDGLEMIIEETGLEKFVEFVEYLTDVEVLTEARAARKARKGAKSYEQVKAEIDAKEKAKSAKREISVDKTKKATETAKAKQPEKKPVRDAIARGVFRAVDAYKKGMERHNAAMATAKKAGKVAGKAAGEFAKGAGEGVKTAGKVAKVAYKVASEEVEVDEKYQGMYQSPAPTHNRLMSSDEKARMSPGRRAMAKSDELEKSEPGSKRAKAQKKAASQIARNFQSARATKEEVEVSEGDKYDNVGKQAARMSLLNNPGPRSTPEQTAEKKARLEKKRGMKLDDHPQFKKEEVDKRRAPAELVARLSAKREGHMAQDGPNKAAYDAKQRILKKTKDKMTEEIVRSILDEAGKKCWKGYKKAGTQKLFGKTYNRCVKANEETEVTEGRAEDAQASLAKVKDRQKVLDAHEKKTGKKLDITKTPEYKSHKQNFPGAKRTGKKVPGAKETPLETHNRRVNKTTARIVDRGYTSKEKKEVKAMAKHASRYD